MHLPWSPTRIHRGPSSCVAQCELSGLATTIALSGGLRKYPGRMLRPTAAESGKQYTCHQYLRRAAAAMTSPFGGSGLPGSAAARSGPGDFSGLRKRGGRQCWKRATTVGPCDFCRPLREGPPDRPQGPERRLSPLARSVLAGRRRALTSEFWRACFWRVCPGRLACEREHSPGNWPSAPPVAAGTNRYRRFVQCGTVIALAGGDGDRSAGCSRNPE